MSGGGEPTSSHLFVTGTPRSGTTLVDKLVSLHPDALVFSQPLPLLYVDVKRAFLRTVTSSPAAAPLAERFPLNDMFGVNHYPPAEFVEFVDGFRLAEPFCRASLERMVPFDGQYTKPERPFAALEGYRPSGLHDFVRRYLRTLASPPPPLIGSKEAYCEEYVPYLLGRGAKVLLILRDPRDVVTSLETGRGREFGGAAKPLLFTLRQWRKSVAVALAHAASPRFLALRYEDLVADPRSLLGRVFGFLELDGAAAAIEEILGRELRAQSGEVWRSNSSHAPTSRITTESVGRYRHHLPPRTERFIQACCFPEMRRLGYAPTVDAAAVEAIWDDWAEAAPSTASGLAALAWDERTRGEEEARLARLADGVFDPALFLFESAFSALREPAVPA